MLEERTAGWAAAEWVRLVIDAGDLRSAWLTMERPLRLTAVQGWLISERVRPRRGESLEAVADALANENPRHAYWQSFEEWKVGGLQEAWADLRGRWGRVWHELPDGSPASSIARGPDLEEVFICLADEATIGDAAAGMPIVAVRMLMRLVDGQWLVAGLDGDLLPVPGWPPTWERLQGP